MNVPIEPLSDEELADLHISHGLADLMAGLQEQRAQEQADRAHTRFYGTPSHAGAFQRLSTLTSAATPGAEGTSTVPLPSQTALVA